MIDGEVIWTNPEHPFYLGNGQWISAGDLQDGDLIRNANWQLGEVQDVTTIYQTRTMYNLSVDTAHTYFVGEQQWLVHNVCTPITISSRKMHSLGGHFNKHGRGMGFSSKKAYNDAAQNFARTQQLNPDAEIYEGIWNGRGKFNGQTQRAIIHNNRTVIVDVSSGQIVDFYEGSDLLGLIHLQQLQ